VAVVASFEVGPWIVQPSLNVIFSEGTTHHIEPKVMQVLVCLIEHAGEAVSKESIFHIVWPDTFVTDDVIKRSILELRRAFEDDARQPRIIQTIPKRGYRLIAPVKPGNGINRPKRAQWEEAHPGKTRLVVLPFQNLTGDPGQEFLASGFTDELITQLSRLDPKRLGVIASTSSNMMRGKSISEIRRALNVQYIVEGSVLSSGGRIRTEVQLIQASDETHVWANSYVRELSDLFRIQSEVSQAVARQMPASLQLASLPPPPPLNPPAHDAYLKGMLHWNNRSDLGRSAALFEEAVRIDPNYGAAYACLASVYITLGEGPYNTLLPREANRKCRAAAQRALELDPSLAEAHAALGMAAMVHDWDLQKAERELRLALELNPSDSSTHEWLGMLFMAQGKTKEALEEGQRSLDLDPVSPACHAFIAQTYHYAGEYEKAIEQARHILDVHPMFLQARYWLGSAYVQKKMLAEAIEQFRLGREYSGDNPVMVMAYGYAQAMAGNASEANAALHQLEVRQQQRYVPALYFAGIYVGLGDNGAAMKYLNEAYEERNDRMIYLRIEPVLNSLRSDPRFLALLDKVAAGPNHACVDEA